MTLTELCINKFIQVRIIDRISIRLGSMESNSYQWTEDGKLIDRTPHELTEQEKTEHADILGGGADG